MDNIFGTVDEIKKELDRDQTIEVKIAFFGQPGAGKSSLINEIVGDDIAEVSVKTDTTVEPSPVRHNGMVLFDLPGYGTEKFPADEYWDKFDLYSYDLFLCVFEGKLHSADVSLFKKVKSKEKECLFIRNKADSLFEKGKTIEELHLAIKRDVETQIQNEVTVLFTSCRTTEGIGVLEEEIEKHLSPAKQERWVRGAKAKSSRFLEKKRKLAEKRVQFYAAMSAANGLNPIPGVNIAVDVSVLMKLFKEIRSNFGLTDECLKDHAHLFAAENLAMISNNLLKTLSTDGIKKLLSKYATSFVSQTFSNIIPIIGPLISSGAGYRITYAAGKSYLDDCYTLAKAILDSELEVKKN